MMGPTKRTIQRSIEQVGDKDNPVKSFEFVDLTCSKQEKSRLRSTTITRSKVPPSLQSESGAASGVSKTKKAATAGSRYISDLNNYANDSRLQTDNLKNNSKAKVVRSKTKTITKTETSTESGDVNMNLKEEDMMTIKKDKMQDDEDALIESQLNSQDDLLLDLSQDGDQCEVKWDYSSPETMKQLKKMKGKYSAQDVKRIIANFPDMPIKTIPPKVHQFTYSLAQRKEVFPERSKIQKARQRAAKKSQQREEGRRVAVENMIHLLQQHQQKQSIAKAETTSRPFEVSTEQSEPTVEKADSVAVGFSNISSEDDLFQDDNSFLIEATQNLEKLFPMTTKELCNKQSKNSSDESSEMLNMDSCDMFSSFLPSSSSTHSLCSKSVIPSSYAGALGKKIFASPVKPLQSNCSSLHANIVPHSATSSNCYRSVNSQLSKHTSNAQKFSDQSKNGTNQLKINQQSSDRFDSTQRTIFRRHQTFQDRQPLSKQSAKVSSTLNSPFRKCLSFDEGIKSKGKTNNICNRKDNVMKKQNNIQNISFDSSLTDELLLQATEVFDSICDRTVGNPKTACNDSQPQATLKSDRQNLTVSQSHGSNTTSESYRHLDITNSILSPVRSLKQESCIKKLQQSNASSSPMQSYFKKRFAIEGCQAAKHKSNIVGPHSTSTPVKVAKMIGQEDEACHNKPQTKSGSDEGEEFFKAFFDDDIFMNDSTLFESEILSVLEVAENQVAEKDDRVSQNPPKFSPGEIEKKRLAALQKLQKNEHVQFLSEYAQSPDIIEQTQISCSPRKCSQEEIKRKKQSAQRKLLARTNSTGSIPIFSVKTTSSADSHSSSNKTAVSEVKCTQEAIQFKREEALKKRRLKLMQIPNRTS